MIENLKVAALTEEADKDYSSAISILRTLDVDNIILTRNHNIKQVIDSGIKVAGAEIDTFDYHLYKDLSLSLGLKFVIMNWDGSSIEDETLDSFVDCSIQGNFLPLICLKKISNDLKPRDKKLEVIFNHSKRLGLCLDPVEILMRYNIDVYAEYFLPFMDRIGALVVRDYLVGVGNRPVGYGSVRWKAILSHIDKYKGWYILKPNLGTQYKDLRTRDAVFKAAFSSFVELVECQ